VNEYDYKHHETSMEGREDWVRGRDTGHSARARRTAAQTVKPAARWEPNQVNESDLMYIGIAQASRLSG
jgi:hypothetical protein